MTGRARNIITVELAYDDYQDDGFSAALWNQFTADDKEAIGRGRIAKTKYFTYNTLNFSFQKKFVNGVSIFGGVYNILGKEINEIALDGRTWRIGAEYKF